MSEDALLTGKLEPMNVPYAIAKIAGIKLCETYNYQYGKSHVIPALIIRFHEANISNASEVVIWGSGTPRREFLFVDDIASASVFAMEIDKKSMI